MLDRKITGQLTGWTLSLPRKPLLITGAGQTGKTTVLKEFSKKFSQAIHVNLDMPSDRKVFEKRSSDTGLLDGLYFLKDKHPGVKRTLIILDEVTSCDAALKWFLRAGEIGPDLFIAATSSENLVIPLSDNRVVPSSESEVIPSSESRVIPEYGNGAGEKFSRFFLHPLSFSEFLASLDDKEALEAYNEVPVPVSGYDKLLRYFHTYTLIGGMPAVVQQYVTHRGLAGLKQVYDQIMERYLADVREMAAGKKSRELIAFTLQNSFPYAATRIKFNGFGNSAGGSREMGEAFRWLENRMLLRLIYPSTSTTGPAACDRRKSPRLQMVDTGLVNYFSGIQKTLYLSRDMNAIFQGQVARQVAGQELMSSDPKGPLHFWVRDKVQSTAEVDFLVSHENMVIPVEVKSGEPGRLRSLHQFMDAAPHPYAVRLHAGPLHIRQTETIRGKRYFLLSLPYFLAERINEHLRGFIRLVGY